MLVNSRKVKNSRLWTVCLALLAVLALTSCKKADEPTASNATPAGAAGGSSAPANSSQASGNKTSTASSKTRATLSPEIQKLGVEPTGTDCPSNAPIKGNLGKGGKKIYHEAKSKGYKAVKPEICFKDVATAKKAGFDAPKGAGAKP